MKKEIVKKLVEYYNTANCDAYGQLKTIDIYNVVKTEKQIEILKEIVEVSTYGYTYGTYLAFRPFGSFKDKKVEELCKNSFMQNPSRRNMNRW
jgi:hypothetical protein